VPKRLVFQVSPTKEKSGMTYVFEGQYYAQAIKKLDPNLDLVAQRP
jgi:hypothetical protein